MKRKKPDRVCVGNEVRQSVIKKKGNDEEDLYLRTLELAQVQEDEYFGHVVSKDLTSILRDIRDTHRKDATTADENCAALEVQKQLQDAMDYKGSTEEKKARLFLANLGIDYDALIPLCENAHSFRVQFLHTHLIYLGMFKLYNNIFAETIDYIIR